MTVDGPSRLDADANRALARDRAAALASGDRAAARRAADAMVVGNLGLAKAEALRRRARWPRDDWGGLSLDDLVQLGVLGLMRAVELYDPDRDSFANYASYWIRQRIGRGIRRQARGFPGIDGADRVRVVRSIDAPMPGDSRDRPFSSVLADPRVREARDVYEIEKLRRLVDDLPRRQRDTIRLQYGLGGEAPLTRAEIARRCGVTHTSVLHLEAKALRTLRRAYGVPRDGGESVLPPGFEDVRRARERARREAVRKAKVREESVA
jgi:RNA polymerase nonessential primary-like sigma factor